jgi:hypothetical protein
MRPRWSRLMLTTAMPSEHVQIALFSHGGIMVPRCIHHLYFLTSANRRARYVVQRNKVGAMKTVYTFKTCSIASLCYVK